MPLLPITPYYSLLLPITPYACSDPQFNDFCGFGYALLGYALTRIGLLLGLMACGVALRIALRYRNWRRVAFLLIGGLIPLCLPFVAFEVRGVLFISGFYDAENALAIFAAGITPYILSAITPLPLLVYALYLMRRMPTAPAGAAGGLA
jgi:hypothetical protein